LLSDQHGDSTERVFLIAFAGTSAKTAESNRTTIGQGMRKPEEDLRSVHETFAIAKCRPMTGSVISGSSFLLIPHIACADAGYHYYDQART
jgi:hypothetical protein